MNKTETIQQFLMNQSAQVDFLGFTINIILTAVLAFALSRMYIKYAKAISNRRAFGGNFVLIGMTTMLIISIVKASLALSLGLVGALSIVRFRAAIKEPEELSYLFLTIGIGLGMGANQRLITIAAFILITFYIVLRSRSGEKMDNRNLFLTLSGKSEDRIDLEQVVDILKKYCSSVGMQRFDENAERVDLSFLVEFSDYIALKNCKTELQNLYRSINISFLDYKGLYGN